MGRCYIKSAIVFTFIVLFVSGCSFGRRVILHPIDKQDIIQMKQGEAYTPDRDGWFMSDMYLEEVIKAKVE